MLGMVTFLKEYHNALCVTLGESEEHCALKK